MKCHEAKTLISLHLDGEASNKQQIQLFEHLKGCAACRQEMVVAKHTHQLLTEHCILVKDVPTGFCDNIMANINFNKEFTPTLIPNTKRTVRKKALWNTRLGVGLAAGVIGLMLSLLAPNWNGPSQIAQKDPVLPKTSLKEGTTGKDNIKVAEGKSTAITKPNNISGDKEPGKLIHSGLDASSSKKIQEKPIQKAANVQLVADLIPSKGSVILPKPLSLTNLVYNQAAEKNISTSTATLQQPAVKPTLLVGNTAHVRSVGNNLEVITVHDNIAKLWQVDTAQNLNAKENDSIEATGALVVKNSKLQNFNAEKAIVSPTGEIATLTIDNGVSQLFLGENNTSLTGKIISDLTWSPDGKKVIYFLVNDNLGHLESFDGINRRQISPDMPVTAISWSFLTDTKMLLNITTNEPGIWELDLNTNKPSPLAKNGGGKCITANSKGDIAFSDSEGKLFVLLADAPSDSKLIQMTSQAADISYITWKDDKTLIYVVSSEDKTELSTAKLP